MKRCLRLAVCLPSLCTVLALAQTETIQPASTSSPVAFLYLAEPTAIDGFAVSSEGKLTELPGLPLAGPKMGRLSVTSKFLFGESTDGSVLNTYSISSKGSLTQVSSINPFNFEPGDNYGCFDNPDLQVDFADSTVYSQASLDNRKEPEYSSCLSSGGTTGWSKRIGIWFREPWKCSS